MKFKHYMHQGFIYGDAEQRGMRVCAISPAGRRHTGVRWYRGGLLSYFSSCAHRIKTGHKIDAPGKTNSRHRRTSAERTEKKE